MAEAGKREHSSTAGHEKAVGKASPAKSEEADQGILANVTEKAKEVAATVGEAAIEAKEKVGELAATAVEKVGEAKHNVQEWASAATDEAGQTMKGAGQELTALVRRYPVPALLVGFGLGFLLARVTSK